MTQFIWDASSYDWARDTDHVVNFAAVRRDGIAGITHKATEGSSYTDPYFDDFARLVNAGGIGFPVVGSYHVLWPGNPNADADHWFATVDAQMPWWKDYPGAVVWQIDAEKFQNMPRAPNLTEIHQCGARLEARGVDPAAIIAYAPHWLYGETLRGLHYKLWSSAYGNNPVAHYRNAYPGDNGQGWTAYSGVTPTLWQYGSQTIIGEQHTCDASAARVATTADLKALFTSGEDMLTAAEIYDYFLRHDSASAAPTSIPSPGTPAANPTWSWQSYITGTYQQATDAENAAKAAVKAVADLNAKVDANQAALLAAIAAGGSPPAGDVPATVHFPAP